MSIITIEDMVEAAERELAMRRGVYPRWVASGKLKQEKADHELTAMAAIVEHLKAERDEWKPWLKTPPFDQVENPAADGNYIVSCLDERSRRPYLAFIKDGVRVPVLPEAYAFRRAPAPAEPPKAPPRQGSLL